MPGVSNFEFIRRHHLRTFLPRLGYGEMEDNSCRGGICEAARMARLDFIVNAVYNAEHEVMALVAGDFEKAHQAGVQMCLDECGVTVEPNTDVTIVSAFPYYEGGQITKPLIPAAMVTKEGGTVILFASTIHGGRLPEAFLEASDAVWKQVEGDLAKTVIAFIKQDRLIIPDGPLDFNAATYLNLLILSRVKVIVVSPDITNEQAQRIGFDYAPTIEEAVKTVSVRLPRATVNILPSGGMIVPFVKEPLTFS
jgi:nickel-dependent lactate racemase